MKRRAVEDAVAVISALAVAWTAFAILVWLYGESPRVVARLLIEGTWGTPYGAGQVLFKATPLLFTGVAVDLALRAGLFNIGGEGQLAVASLAVAVVGARVGALPAIVALPASFSSRRLLAGAMGPGARAAARRFGAHEVIATIMMNRIADAAIGAAHGRRPRGRSERADAERRPVRPRPEAGGHRPCVPR